MTEIFINLSKVSFSYENSAEQIIDEINVQFEKGWTGITGVNGGGKTTLLKLITGELKPDKGIITIPGTVYYCSQQSETVPEGLDNFIYSYNKKAFKIKEELGIKDEWLNRWESLSYGERKRCQIASALYYSPDILAVDEPTNHLDYKTKLIVINALKSFTGIGLLISHDRELLDSLCRYTVIIGKNKFIKRTGNYSTATEELKKENEYNLAQYNARKKEVIKLNLEVDFHKQKASNADSERSKRKLDRNDTDGRAKIDFARVTGKDAVEGKIYNRLKARLSIKEKEKENYNYEKSFELGIVFNGNRSKNRNIFNITAGNISINDKFYLEYQDLSIERNDKIALTGDNGSGKSTFIRFLINNLKLVNEKYIYIPQEINASEASLIIERIKKYKNEDKGKIITIVSRLGSDAKRVLDTNTPSPGEVRKLLIAESILTNPELIIMDEPTNHMDLPSVECLEKALKEVNCALLMVSHDRMFLSNLAEQYWDIRKNKEGKFYLKEI